MKILVLGGGGREHALVWKLKQKSVRGKNLVCPGNGGIAADGGVRGHRCRRRQRGALRWPKRFGPDLTVVGPELPLVERG